MREWLKRSWGLGILVIALILLPRKFLTSHWLRSALVMVALGVVIGMVELAIRKRNAR